MTTNTEKTEKTDTLALSARELKTALKMLAPFVGRDGFSALLFEVRANLLTLTASDGVHAARATLLCRGNAARERALSADFGAAAGFVGVEDAEQETFGNEDGAVCLVFSDDALRLNVMSGAGRRSLTLRARAGFALSPDFGCGESDTKFELPDPRAFASALSDCLAAAAKNDDREALCGVCLRFDAAAETLTLCATDGRAAHEIRMNAAEPNPEKREARCLRCRSGDEELCALFPRAAVERLLKSLKCASPRAGAALGFRRKEAGGGEPAAAVWTFSATTGDRVRALTPLSPARYPDLAPVFAAFDPAAEAAKDVAAVRADADVLAGALAQILKTSAESSGGGTVIARLDFSAFADRERADILVSSADGSYEAAVPASLMTAGAPVPAHALEQKFSAALLADALAAFAGGQICLCFAPGEPFRATFTQPEDFARPLVSSRRRAVMAMK